MLKHNLYIIWKSDNELGIPVVDEQHRAIISVINTLHYFTIHNMGKEVLESILITLKEYTKYHFMLEENVMEMEGYPDFDHHQKLHNQLAIKMKQISSKIKIEHDPGELLKFLRDWWLNHICVEDRKYAEFINNKTGGV
ncbi:bacteriohemerythrin [Verrucomicrobia bacterium S94]|nr:bacteriohemerythrin [Verrucomicrobia bacterium S94]